MNLRTILMATASIAAMGLSATATSAVYENTKANTEGTITLSPQDSISTKGIRDKADYYSPSNSAINWGEVSPNSPTGATPGPAVFTGEPVGEAWELSGGW